jgi:5-formyltetrahydrofolate cyclo-ligase
MIKKQKDDIREEYKERRSSMSPEEKFVRDEAICRAAEGLVSFRYAEFVLLYAATPDEIDVFPLARTALAKGKKVLFPRCDKKTHTMQYHIVESADALTAGAYGILEPSADAPVWHADHTEADAHPVCIVPGLVFDRAGYRVGYGKGYYDRYLSTFPGVRVGTVYADCVLAQIPRGRFDLSVDVLVTEKGVRAVNAN